MYLCYLVITLVLFCVAPTSCMYCATPYTPLTAQQMTSYNQSVLDQVQLADIASMAASQTLGSASNLSGSESARLNLIIQMSQVKHTLASTLLNTPSMDSPVVRSQFLSLMGQETISKEDLQALQTLINSEKALMANTSPTGATGAAGATAATGATAASGVTAVPGATATAGATASIGATATSGATAAVGSTGASTSTAPTGS